MRAKQHWKKAALLGALLVCGGCSKKEESAPAAPLTPSWPSAQAPAAAEQPRDPALEKPSQADYVGDWKPVAGPTQPDKLPPDFKVGQPREVVMALLGDCAERMHFIPGGSGNLTVEIVQPKAGDCRKRLGDRHFTLRGEKLYRITAGALPPPEPPPPPREDR